MKVTAVVVTYNRFDKLRLCLSALLEQTVMPAEILVVDNASTDGTCEWLEQEADAHKGLVRVMRLPENIGGAGGFERGVCEAVESGTDYAWIMDDDTVPSPTALAELLRAVEHGGDKIGFAASRVNWTDGSLHLMNLPLFASSGIDINVLDKPTECTRATFVSLLIPSAVVRKVGLPIGEYFIWNDDIEYTGRIVRSGYHGLYVPSSIVTHFTEANRGSSITDAPLASIHRFYYQMRNEMWTRRSYSNPIVAFVSNCLRLHRALRRVKRRTSFNSFFREEVMMGFRAGLRKRPAIRFPKNNA